MTRYIDADALHEIRFTDIFNENVRHSKSKLYMLGWNDAIDAIIYDTPTVDAVPVEWIPVSEQMPKEFKTVLVFALSDDGDHGFMTTASHEGRGIWYDECFYQPLPKVYAWMPLPEPYLVKF